MTNQQRLNWFVAMVILIMTLGAALGCLVYSIAISYSFTGFYFGMCGFLFCTAIMLLIWSDLK